MKTRTGFVSNSSSSSFTCEVCGGNESGWDLSLQDANMVECANGHVFHEHCAEKKILGELKKYLGDTGDRYEADPKFCPICSFAVLDSDDAIQYMLHRYGMNRDEVLAEIKSKFKTYDEFLEAIRPKKGTAK